jgi:hypothetical protein
MSNALETEKRGGDCIFVILRSTICEGVFQEKNIKNIIHRKGYGRTLYKSLTIVTIALYSQFISFLSSE